MLKTRFSVRLGPDLPRHWLQRRIELLRRVTLPSVAAQTASAFTWLVLCDEATDASVLEQLHAEERQLPTMRVVLTGDDRTALDVVRAAVDPDADVLITTRLDSDDAIADTYLEAVQEYATSFRRSSLERLLVNFPRGYRLELPQRRLYTSRMANSAFHSLFERPGRHAPQTVMSAGDESLRRSWYRNYRRLEIAGKGGANWHSHAHLHQHYPTHQDESIPAWLIAVHGGNVINRITPDCRPLPPGSQPLGFTILEQPATR